MNLIDMVFLVEVQGQGGDSSLGNGVSVYWERFSHRRKAIQTHLEVFKWVNAIKNTICGIY